MFRAVRVAIARYSVNASSFRYRKPYPLRSSCVEISPRHAIAVTCFRSVWFDVRQASLILG